MKGIKTVFIAVSLCLLFAVQSFAVPASPFPFTAEQPNGEKITILKRGDESHNWVEGADGYSVVRSSSGYWEYAVKDGDKLAPSGVVYSNGAMPPAGVQKHLAPEKTGYESKTQVTDALTRWEPKPLSGTRRILVIRAAFSNISFDYPESTHSEQFFGTKSIKQYYHDQSLGKLNIESALGGIKVVTVTLPTPHPDRNLKADVVGLDTAHQNEVAFITAALEAAIAQGAGFAEFDTNNDGRITPDELCVYLIVAGYEESGDKVTPAVWAHAWNSWSDDGPLHNVKVSGKILSDWAMNGERLDNTAPMGIAVIAHELGHQFCHLPDLYDTSYYNQGMGGFSLMAGGSWGAEKGGIPSSMPVNLDAWSRQYLGWETPQTPKSGAVTIKKAGSGNGSVKLYGEGHRETEYFLVEIRDFSGWDKGMEALLNSNDTEFKGGLLIQHIDEEVGAGKLDLGNDINTFKQWKHQGVMAVEADGRHMVLPRTDKNSNHGTVNTLWWGGNSARASSGARTAATLDFKAPDSNFYDAGADSTGTNKVSGISISGIGDASGGAISVSGVSAGTPKPFATNPPVTGDSGGGCNVGWAGLLLTLAIPFALRKRK